ncbi:MAG: hypothetical protein HKN29_11740 [Rhodothermales bacterium]|nr:hypothetical protein [Rhodothermales bacterium]
MTKQSRITLALASLLLVLMYVAPLWNITLEAPQYPEGLGLKIMLTDVQGQKQHDLRNINNLNHYIGMKEIQPDAIPELKVMPWIVAFLMAFGLLAALSGKPALLYAWCVVFFIVAIAGLVDFWLWAYDYGHNLDTEHAAIKVPGMTYQPPIIGSKKLLNFTAHSWPALGGWAAFVSLGAGFLTAFTTWRSRKSAGPKGLSIAAAAVLVVGFAGCTPEPQPFVYGEDQDAYCRMTISDARFASQVVTTTGKAYKFDSIECMSSFLAAGTVAAEDVHSVWVSDASYPGALIEAGEAQFVRSDQIRSPMGGGLLAFSTSDAARQHARQVSGEVLAWQEVEGFALTDAGTHRH